MQFFSSFFPRPKSFELMQKIQNDQNERKRIQMQENEKKSKCQNVIAQDVQMLDTLFRTVSGTKKKDSIVHRISLDRFGDNINPHHPYDVCYAVHQVFRDEFYKKIENGETELLGLSGCHVVLPASDKVFDSKDILKKGYVEFNLHKTDSSYYSQLASDEIF